MPEKARRGLVGHWDEIGAMTGVAFSPALADREGFVYDTDPAARAVVLARRTSDDEALDYSGAPAPGLLRRGPRHHRPGRAGARSPPSRVSTAPPSRPSLADEGLKNETWRDYAISQRAGATGFPTLVGRAQRRRHLRPGHPRLSGRRDHRRRRRRLAGRRTAGSGLTLG